MSFLRWAGSKRQLLETLSCCWHATNCASSRPIRYIEGFSGSAALFFYVQPKRAILVDINQDLQQCLLRVKSEPKGVSYSLSQIPSSENDYYRIRATDRSSLTPNQRAAAFIYLNRHCFNGLYRTNRQGHFNVPYGGGRSGNLPTYSDLLRASKTLQAAEIIAGDFYESLHSKINSADFIYLDPPYAKRNADLDNQYGPDVFGLGDIAKLEKLLERANEVGAKFLVSYAKCDEISALADRWCSHVVGVRRTIAANVLRRGFAEELLITNL
jgi:DNA adenine methylase